MSEPLVTLAELAEGLEWTLSDEEERLAEATLEDLSDDARLHGSEGWVNATVAPDAVKRLVKRVARRFLRNPDGYVTSRAGDETLTWSDTGERAGTAFFTDDERKALRAWAGKSSLSSVPLYHSSTKTTPDGYVPTVGGKPFPFFADPEY